MTTTREDRERAAKALGYALGAEAVRKWVEADRTDLLGPNPVRELVAVAREFATLRERAATSERERDEARAFVASAKSANEFLNGWIDQIAADRDACRLRAGAAEQRAAGLEGALRDARHFVEAFTLRETTDTIGDVKVELATGGRTWAVNVAPEVLARIAALSAPGMADEKSEAPR